MPENLHRVEGQREKDQKKNIAAFLKSSEKVIVRVGSRLFVGLKPSLEGKSATPPHRTHTWAGASRKASDAPPPCRVTFFFKLLGLYRA